MEAIGEIMEYTCVNFTAKTSRDRDYVNVVKKEGCSSHVGRRGGAQKLNIGAECAYDVNTTILWIGLEFTDFINLYLF